MNTDNDYNYVRESLIYYKRGKYIFACILRRTNTFLKAVIISIFFVHFVLTNSKYFGKKVNWNSENYF